MNLAINTIALPITAYASILHRVSSVIVWFAMITLFPVICYMLHSAQSFNELSKIANENFIVQFIIWGYVTALGYYCLGTIKHIIQEFGYCEELDSGKVISWLAIGFGILISLLFAGWMWL